MVDVDQRDLEDVRRQALDAGVHRLPFTGHADRPHVRRQLGDLATSTEQGLGVPALAGLGHRPLHVRLHRRERHEVRVEDLLRLRRRDVQPLTQPVRLHAVGEAVGDHLRLRPLLDRHVGRFHREDARRRPVVDVGAGGEGLDQTRILGQVGDAPQLDLVVVGDQELEPGGGHERLAELPAALGPHRDVVQVRLVRREPSRARHGLVEGGMDPTVGRHLGQQSLAVGRPQLLDLAVGEQVIDDRMLAGELLERGGVGREAGLRLLLRRQLQLVEQDLAELLGRVDVEVLAGVLDDRGSEPVALGGHLVVETSQLDDVDADADVLHAGQHLDEGHLDVVVERGEASRVERAQQPRARAWRRRARRGPRAATDRCPSPPRSS